MTYLDSIILGILQGLTEFLPVSSSGHLVLAQALLKVKQPGVSFEILVHLGSLLAVLIYFRIRIFQLIKSLYDEDYKKYRPIVWFIIIGTIPAVIIGLSLKDFFEEAFSSPSMASTMLIITGLILLSTRFIKKSNKKINLSGAIIMGIGQALAIMPGISRSGTTIS
ncbi:MAG: undecaprenyl-diphosphate phosphatase, partial [candidate division Zixibacteria bacterium]|nr:undecaprenyl-diphosphate phosphatase [candidate division Zixibacteria bacterium]